MSSIFKREAVYAITGISAVIMIIDFFFFSKGLPIANTLRTYTVIIFNISLGLGAVKLLTAHSRTVQRRGKNWELSVWFIIFFAIVFLAGIAGYATTGKSTSNGIYDWVYAHVYRSLRTTLYALTGFYIMSAAYRAFRARNIDAALMLIAGCLVMLTNATIGEAIYPGIPVLGSWIQLTAQVPGIRVITLVLGLGLLAYGFRAMTGKEKGFYGGVTEGE